MEDLTKEFNYIFTQTVEFYIDRKNYIENIGRTEVIPKSITKEEIKRAYYASIYALIITLQSNELFINGVVILSDSVEQTASQVFDNKLYPLMESYLINTKGISVTNPNNI